jgi:hypothetical protein
MKLNRALLVAAAAVLVGSVAVVGCHRADDESDETEVAPTEQASLSSGDEAAETAPADVGVEQYARGGGAHGGGAHGGAAHGGAHAGARGGAHGFGHGGRAYGGRGGRGGWGWGGWRRDHRYYPWW